MKNIVVIGLGYVGLANALFLARNNTVTGIDISEEKINMLNNNESYIKENLIEQELLVTHAKFTTNKNCYKSADYFFIAVPTNYDEDTDYFDMSVVTSTIDEILSINKNCKIIIKSTVPIGYTEQVKKQFNYPNIIFMPEFLREGSSLYDCTYPDRIIVGSLDSNDIADLFSGCVTDNILYMSSTEAEAVKLFANNYLAMRVAFFNELDTFADVNNLNTKNIILGVSTDSRIGKGYNNPSFGYGGYCFPKDTKQLTANYKNIPQNIISSIVRANETRKDYIVSDILNTDVKKVGIYKLAMKSNSDNSRYSAILDIIKKLKESNIECIIYDDSITEKYILDCVVETDFNTFINSADLIVTNRIDDKINKITKTVYTRDIFHNN